MDTSTGHIFTPEQIDEMRPQGTKYSELFPRLLPMDTPPTAAQLKRTPPRVGRNEPCPCGSGRKFKHCHLNHQ